MEKIFHKWLFCLIGIVFVLALFLTYLIQTRYAQSESLNLIELNVSEAKKQIEQSNKNLEAIKKLSESLALTKASFANERIAQNPSFYLKNPYGLDTLKKEIDVEEIHVTNKDGVIIASSSPIFIHYDFKSSPQSAAFLPAIKDKNFRLVQEPEPRGYDRNLFQYVGVSRLDAPGIVQIGFYPTRYAAALQIADLQTIISSIRIGKTGEIIACDMTKDECFNNGPAFRLTDNFRKELLEQQHQKKGSIVTLNGKKYFAKLERFGNFLISGFIPKNEMFLERDHIIILLIIVNTFLFLIIFSLTSFLIRKLIISGIKNINSSLVKITNGDLNETINVRQVKEFAELSDGINHTVDSLKLAIENVKLRISTELRLAKAIQLSFLPKELPKDTSLLSCIDLESFMDTAYDVGGDFYDYCQHKDGFYFLIADVSGKGIPAALFMMEAKAILQNDIKKYESPAKILMNANNQICQNNKEGMFVTLFLCRIDLNSGVLTFSNAGHNAPYLRQNNSFKLLSAKPGLVLGVMENIHYTETSIELQNNDTIFLYTDGLVEALNPQNEFFGTDNLTKIMLSARNSSVKEIVQKTKESLFDFTKNQIKADDVTMLCVQYKGSNKLHVLAYRSNLAKANSWLENCLATVLELSHKKRSSFFIILEEIFVNICLYAYKDKNDEEKTVDLYFYYNPETKLITLEFQDFGIPFDPLKTNSPDTKLPAEKRHEGGLGIFITKKLSKECFYKYSSRKNILTIILDCYDK